MNLGALSPEECHYANVDLFCIPFQEIMNSLSEPLF